jgi:hypothetical protein
MSKGSRRRPAAVPVPHVDDSWVRTFGPDRPASHPADAPPADPGCPWCRSTRLMALGGDYYQCRDCLKRHMHRRL